MSILPSVHHLLRLHPNIDLSKVVPTSPKKLITKGDVLAYLGKIASASGTLTEEASKSLSASPAFRDKGIVTSGQSGYGGDDNHPSKQQASSRPLTASEFKALIQRGMGMPARTSPRANLLSDLVTASQPAFSDRDYDAIFHGYLAPKSVIAEVDAMTKERDAKHLLKEAHTLSPNDPLNELFA